MPTLNKVYTLTITPEQFVEACSDVELEELQLLLDRKKQNQFIKENQSWLEENTQE
jgi:hypothetical protein